MVEAERDGWILVVAASWPEDIPAIMAAKFAQLDDPQLVRLYRLGSEILDSDAGDDDPRLEEAADIMAGLLEQAYTPSEEAPDDLPFISSAFVPTDTMPGPVRAFAEHQPATPIVNAIRDLFTQQPVGTDIWTALAWCVGILVVAYIFANISYRRRIA